MLWIESVGLGILPGMFVWGFFFGVWVGSLVRDAYCSSDYDTMTMNSASAR